MNQTHKRRYAQIGLGGRSLMFRNAILETFKDTSRLVAFCDNNRGRLQLAVEHAHAHGSEVPGYGAEAFERMIAETQPSAVIVTSVDSSHDEYICRAMEQGCDVITEKPMTIDEFRCRRILETQRRTGRKIMVTFNYRYSPPRTQVKDLLMQGVIGEVLSVDFNWLLDTHHGADYFRRWHRRKDCSGGLLVHKATHHFDLVNWWLSTVPESVCAQGHRRFYVPSTADRYGLTRRAARCHDCPEAERCPFALKMRDNNMLRSLYLDTETHDGYFRDRCVFAADIDIEDCANVLVRYRNGVKMAYSLNAFMPWEGFVVALNGTRGRLEHHCQETVYINGDGTVPGALKKEGTRIRIFPQREAAYEVDLWKAEGGHGGADPVMLRHLFRPEGEAPDKYFRAADQRAGAWSILTGIAANRSMQLNAPVAIESLVPGLDMPDYPHTPTGEEALPLPGCGNAALA